MSESVGVSENTSFQVKRMVKASRQWVFDSWTKPELMQLWFAPRSMTVPAASADLRVGGAYSVEMEGGTDFTHVAIGVYKEIVPNRRLSFTWGWQNDPSAESLVTVVFRNFEGGTEVILTHERLASEESRDKHLHGWEGCLENLARQAEVH